LKTPKIIVGSGWWSTPDPNPWMISDAITRTPEFFGLWLHLVRKYIAPARIVIVDSHAPRKPPPDLRAQVEWIELDENYGHANDLRFGVRSGKYCGVMRALLATATLALCNDADLYAYIEQGALIRGEGFVQRALGGREPTILIGQRTIGGRGLRGPALEMHQMSVVIVGRAGLERFIASLLAARETDGELPPEVKLEKYCAPFELLGVPFGRSRPLDFSLPAFYVKHATTAELREFLELENIEPAVFGLSLPA
jgi:hypothetical protein